MKRFGLNWPPRVAKLKTNHQTALRALVRHTLQGLLTASILMAGTLLIILSLGVHVPFLNSLHADAVTVKPKIITKASAPKACAPTTSQSNLLFSSCPSFAVDYGSQGNGSINSSLFNVTTGPSTSNHEVEYYTGDQNNLRVANGSLILEARNQSAQGYKYTSAKIDTHGKEDFLYGKIVVRAELPDGIGTWPAIWMLPSQPKYAGLSPASNPNRYLNDGEIDVAESVGVEPHVVYGVAHSLAFPEDGPNRSYYSTTQVLGNDTTYHNYELDWTPASLTFSIDGMPFYTYSKQTNANWRSWPYDQPFYLVIDLAMGGPWAGKDKQQFPGDGIDKSALPADLKVQSINYYSYLGTK